MPVDSQSAGLVYPVRGGGQSFAPATVSDCSTSPPFKTTVTLAPTDVTTPMNTKSSSAKYLTSTTFPPSPPSSAESSPIDNSPLAQRVHDSRPTLARARSAESLGSVSTFISDVFPQGHALVGTAVDVEANDAPEWTLAMVGRSLFAKMPTAADAQVNDLRNTVVAVLERADDLDCDAVIVVLEKNSPDLASTIHSLFYVGGSIVSPSTLAYDSSRYILVGLDV